MDKINAKLVIEELNNHPNEKGYLLDGFPVTPSAAHQV